MRACRSPEHRGMALVAVLWIVAALSLIVGGLVSTSRAEIRQVGAAKEVVLAEAYGVAAINQVLQELLLQPAGIPRFTVVPTQFEGVRIPVEVIPISGFINLNSAPQPLLVQLFVVAGGLSPDAANALAGQVMEVRQLRDSSGRQVGFDSPEDLLQLPGVDYPLYARLASLLVADRQGAGGVNPLAAPPDVLWVLAGGNRALADQIQAARAVAGGSVDTSSMDPGLLNQTAGNRYRLVARVPLADGRWLLSIRGVDTGAGVRDGLPWRIFASERRIDAPRRF